MPMPVFALTRSASMGSRRMSHNCSSEASASDWDKSTLFITGIILRPKLCAKCAWATVCASTPCDASTKSSTPSHARRERATS